MWSTCCLALAGLLALALNVAAAPATPAAAGAAPAAWLSREASEEIGVRELPLEDGQAAHLPNSEPALGRPPAGGPATGWAPPTQVDPQHMLTACRALECEESGRGDCPEPPPGISASARMCRQFKWILAQAQRLSPTRAQLSSPAPGKHVGSSGYTGAEGMRIPRSGQKGVAVGIQDDPDWSEISASNRAMIDMNFWQVIRKLIDMLLDGFTEGLN